MARQGLADRIRRGMDVYGIDGRHIGAVIELKAADPEPAAPVAPESGAVVEALTAPSAGPGTLPLGTTTPKGRGGATTTGIAGSQGDFPTVDPLVDSGDPNAAGLDMLRGHTPRRAALGDADSTAEASARSATGSLHGAGALGGPAPLDTGAHPAEHGAPPIPAAALAQDGAVLLVQDPGTLGIAAQLLHIPLDAVRAVEPARGVTLAMAGEEARMRFGRRGLDLDESADVLPY